MYNIIDNIRALAEKLGLYNIASGIVPLYDFPEDALVKLELILMQEANFKDERRYKVLYSRSHLLPLKTFEEFDNKFQPVVTNQLIVRLKNLSWVEDKYNMIMIGGSGTGKTHIATAIGHYAIRNGIKTFYAEVRDLIYYIKTQDSVGKSRTKLGYLYNCELVIIDELCYESYPFEDMRLVYDVIKRLSLNASVILISNRTFDMWPQFIGDVTMTNTMIDRLIEKCQVLDFGDKSYRVENHQPLIFKRESEEEIVPICKDVVGVREDEEDTDEEDDDDEK